MSDICHECGHDFDAARAELEKVKQERQELADAGIIVSRALTQAATDLSEALELLEKVPHDQEWIVESSPTTGAWRCKPDCLGCRAAWLRERRGK